MSKKKQKVLILISGGIDSTACIHYYHNLNFRITGLFIDYGQKSRHEEFSAIKSIAKFYNIDFIKIAVSSPIKMTSGLINGRNLFLISTALLGFKNNGLVAIGIHDGTKYNDCQYSFIEAVQKVVDIYYNGTVKIDAPFVKFTKNEIWNYTIENNIPINLTYSCENGLTQPCGKCESCKDLLLLYESSKKYIKAPIGN